MDLPALPLLLVPDTLASAPLRGALVMGFVIALFGVAFGAVKVGQRKQATRAASDLSALTGTGDGAHRGGDGSVSTDWWNTAAGQDVQASPTQTWQSAFLDEPADAPEPGGQPAYGRTLDVPSFGGDVAAEPAVTGPVAAAVAATDVDDTPDSGPLSGERDAAVGVPENITWSDVEADADASTWSESLSQIAAFDEPDVDADLGDGTGEHEQAKDTSAGLAPVSAGVSEPVRTDITYVPDPQAAPAPASFGSSLAEVAAVAIYDELIEPVQMLGATVAAEPAQDDAHKTGPATVSLSPVEPGPLVVDAPISLSPGAFSPADNSWGADEAGDDDGTSPTWWQQAIADDK